MLKILLVTLALAGCSKEKRIRGDFEMICNGFEPSGAAQEKDPGKKAAVFAKYVAAHLKSEEVTLLMKNMSALSPEEKRKAFEKGLAESGYTGPCPFWGRK